MNWNYRVINVLVGEDEIFMIGEVHYDDEGEPKAWSESGVLSESKEDLREVLGMMEAALAKDIIYVEKGEDEEYYFV